MRPSAAPLRRRRLAALAAAWALLGACSAGPAPNPPPVATQEEQDPVPAHLPECRGLVDAAPDEWSDRWRALHGKGVAIVPALVRAVRERPEGPGAQAALHLLGVLQAEPARAFLEDVLDDGTALGSEAALALGRLGGARSVPALRRAVDAATCPITTRVAAAAALVTLGEAPEIAGFLEAVFLAASPDGAASSRRHGIPTEKTRWAEERYMVIEALRARYGGQTFGLDEDASWPAARAAVTRMQAFLRAQRRG